MSVAYSMVVVIIIVITLMDLMTAHAKLDILYHLMNTIAQVCSFCESACIYACIVLDINECNDDNGGCSQICTNTMGSYYCSCKIGYFNLTVTAENCSGMIH